MSQGMLWASRVTTIGLEFALPALAGVGVDRYVWKIGPTGVLIGAALGFTLGMYHLLRISRESSDGTRSRPPEV